MLGAPCAGANRVILPSANQRGIEHDVAKEVRARIQFVLGTVRKMLDAAFEPGWLPWHAPHVHPLL